MKLGQKAEKLQTLHNKTQALLVELQSFNFEINSDIVDNKVPDTELVDMGYLFRETANVLDEARKECNAQKGRIEKLVGLKMLAKFTETQDPEVMKLNATLCSARVDAKPKAQVPEAGSENYFKMLRWFGIPDRAIETKAITIHYMRLQDLIAEYAEQGKAFPDGLLGVGTEPQIIFTKKRKTGE